MKYWIAFLLLTMAPLLPLDRLRWKNRVVVVFSTDPASPQLHDQDRLLADGHAGLEERDVKIFHVLGDSGDAVAANRSKLGVENHSFALVLVGKDGAVKLRKYHPVAASELFSLIDSMPMRKDEMKR